MVEQASKTGTAVPMALNKGPRAGGGVRGNKIPLPKFCRTVAQVSVSKAVQPYRSS